MTDHIATTPCPCCGAPMEADSATALARAARMRGEVTPQQLALVEALDAAKGALVSAYALAGKVWADDPNGGPLAVKESVHLMARRAARALPGWAIIGVKGPGGGYRLVRVEK